MCRKLCKAAAFPVVVTNIIAFTHFPRLNPINLNFLINPFLNNITNQQVVRDYFTFNLNVFIPNCYE